MTPNETIFAELDPSITHLARLILDTDDLDMIDAIDALAPLLAPTTLRALCDALDCCPMHLCDAAICADDEIDECAELRN